uniref:Uncharacterized protein n=1 Tax=Meloidogyne floridensis TaxID=298350 RepID=A0A915NG97_9BILA
MFSKLIYLIIFALLFLVGNIVCPRGDNTAPGPNEDPPCYLYPTGKECKKVCRENINDPNCRDFCKFNSNEVVCKKKGK